VAGIFSIVLTNMRICLSDADWLQTEGGLPGLRPRGDVMGTPDGLAKRPYIRESRRIRALFTVTEEMLSPGGVGARTRAQEFPDSVGVGYYRIDLHPSTGGGPSTEYCRIASDEHCKLRSTTLCSSGSFHCAPQNSGL
jgi:hypothetical protein